MATNDSTTGKQVAYLLNQIALQASILEAAMDKSDSDEVALYQATVSRIGFLADLAQEKLGSQSAGQVRGEAENWLLPDFFRDMENAEVDHG